MNTCAITEKVVKAGEFQEVVIAVKNSLDGHFLIDARKWKLWNGERRPAKGLTLQMKNWPQVIKAVQELLDEYKGNH